MLAQNDDRNELIAMLAWQLDMGIDETLLDHHQADAVPLRLDQLLAVAALCLGRQLAVRCPCCGQF